MTLLTGTLPHTPQRCNRFPHGNLHGSRGVIPQMISRAARCVPTVAVTALMLAACGGTGATPRRGTRTSQPAASTPARAASAAAPCVPAAIHHSAPPNWTASAWSASSPGFAVPYALATGNAAAAFFFAPTLRAGHPSNPSNKVLWVVRFPRDGHPLTITARPSTDRAHFVRTQWPADSSPGEIYPSDVDLPKPGCWRLGLAWGTHRASVDVQVKPAA